MSRLVVLLGVLLWAHPAAGKPRRVVLMATAGPVVQRLQAELGAAGWHTTRVPPRERQLDLIGLHAAMSSHQATAAIALRPSTGGALDVWIVDDVGMVVSQERFQPTTLSDVVALRTAERLRAYGLRVKTTKTTKTSRAQPSARLASQHPDPELHPDLKLPSVSTHNGSESLAIRGGMQLNGGLAVGWAPGGLSPTSQLRLGGSWTPRSWLAMDVVLIVPMVPAHVANEGETDVYIALAAAGLRWLGGSARARLRPSLGAGIGALLFHLRGDATEPLTRSAEPTLVTAMPYVEGACMLRLSTHLRLSLSYLVGLPMQRLVVVHSGTKVATVDRLLLTGTLGLELEL